MEPHRAQAPGPDEPAIHSEYTGATEVPRGTRADRTVSLIATIAAVVVIVGVIVLA